MLCTAYYFSESASFTHVSGLLHALVAITSSRNPLPSSSDSPSTTEILDEALPITSFACEWKIPRKRKENNSKMSDIAFKKHVYGRHVKHNLQSLSDYDPRPTEYHNTAQDQLKHFLSKVKGKGLGVSVLFDPDSRVWEPTDLDKMEPVSQSQLPSKEDLVKRVEAFKESLKLSPEKIRALERDTTDQSQSALCKALQTYSINVW